MPTIELTNDELTILTTLRARGADGLRKAAAALRTPAERDAAIAALRQKAADYEAAKLAAMTDEQKTAYQASIRQAELVRVEQQRDAAQKVLDAADPADIAAAGVSAVYVK